MIQIKDVSFSYKNQEKEQLSNVTLTIQSGEFILLSGKSGCGKTTMTKLINGLIPHFAEGKFIGDIFINGQNTRGLKTFSISEYVGSIFQNPKTQFFNLDTDSELAFGLENMGTSPNEIRKRVEHVVDELEIKRLLNRGVFELSGGEKQSLAIASVYATNPDVYVFDEPSANIDEEGIESIRNVLKKLKKQGKTIIIAEHRLFYLMDLIDRVVYLKNGAIQSIWTQKEFLKISDMKRRELGLRTFYPIKSYCNNLLKENTKKNDLIIEKLSYKHKKHEVLKNISLTANIGEVIAITGRNGAGKSTFMRCLCGLVKESDGMILYKDKVCKSKDRLNICYMIMQDVVHQLFAENVKKEFELLNNEVSEKKIEEILTKLELNDFINKHPMTLSGGQMQRLAIAVAMLSARDVIVFDEPSSGLDYSNMLVVSGLIRKLSESKIIFIITHDKELIHETCSRVINIEEGIVREK